MTRPSGRRGPAPASGFRGAVRGCSRPLLALLVLAASACERPDESARIARRAPFGAEAPGRPPLDFATLSPGDSVLGLRVDTVAIRPDPVDSFGWMGQVVYSGPVELVGEYRAHMDFPDVEEPCFFVDDSVAGRLPRFPNDVRRSWFCFENAREAVDRLGRPDSASRARIVIDRFRYHYQHTDVYNVARLARVLERGASP